MNYKIKSLGYRTDFIFNRLDGSVRDKGEYIVATTTSNPNYFWGNLLLYKQPPKQGDFSIWKSDFLAEFTNPDIYHMTFAWDSPEGVEGDCSEFLAQGFKLEKSVVLTTENVIKPTKYNHNVLIRPISSQEDFDRCVDIQVSCSDQYLSKDSWRDFYSKSMKQYKKLIGQGHGKWFGAFLDGELVGSLGIFTDQDIARFQIVSTHKDFQRRGVCSTLVFDAAKYALDNMGVKTLVMVADEEYHAAKIYESVGFTPKQEQIGVCFWDKSKLE